MITLSNDGDRTILVDLEAVGIPKESVYPSYAKGGCIKEITQGKYPFDFLIPEDSLSKNAFFTKRFVNLKKNIYCAP